MQLQHVIGSIYEAQLEYTRAFVLEDTPAGETTLIDAGFERTADELVSALREEFGDVDRVIITHEGRDHYEGLDAVMDAFDPLLAVAAGEEDLHSAIDHEPDTLFDHGDILPGDIEVIQVPGHSPCPSALLVRADGALISGDVLDGADRRGLPAGYLLPPPETFNWDHASTERGLETLLDYEFDTVLVAHGSHVLSEAGEKLDRYVNFKDHYRQSLLEE